MVYEEAYDAIYAYYMLMEGMQDSVGTSDNIQLYFLRNKDQIG